MKKMVAMLILVFALVAPPLALGEPPPHLDFIHKLRARGQADLALKYIDDLGKDFPADVKPFLALEKASIHADQAAKAPDPARRDAIYKNAREELLAFIKGNAKNPLADVAAVEAARVLTLQGRNQIAMAHQPGRSVSREMQKAFDHFVQAGSEFLKLEGPLATQLGGNHPSAIKKALQEASDLAAFEKTANLLDKASTYDVLKKPPEERLALVQRAITGFKAMAANSKSPNSLLARAWLVRAYLEIEKFDDSKRELEALLKETSPQADVAKRQAQYFKFQAAIEDTGRRDAANIAKLGQEWLDAYPGSQRTAEGNRVRFEVANSYLKLAQAIPKPKTPGKDGLDPKARELYGKAMALYASLEEPANEFSDEASQLKSSIRLTTAASAVVGNISSYKTFQDCQLASQSMAAKLAEAQKQLYAMEREGKTDAKKLTAKRAEVAEKRKKTLKDMTEVLHLAIKLADKGVKPQDEADVRSTLAYLYLERGDNFRAALMGEYAARHLRAPRAASAAGYAVQAYANLLAQAKSDGLNQKDIDGQRQRLLDLADFMEKTWPADRATDAARHHVGTLLMQEGAFKEAEKYLSRVSPSYSPSVSLMDARYWWAVAAQQMLKDAALDGNARAHYQKQAQRALEEIPTVNPGVRPELAQMYFTAKLQLGRVLFESKKFEELEKLASDLETMLPRFKLRADLQSEIHAGLESLGRYGRLGRAYKELAAGQTASAKQLGELLLRQLDTHIKKLEAEEAQLKSKPAGKELANVQERLHASQELRRNARILLLLAVVQEPNIAQARKLFLDLQEDAKDVKGPAIYAQLAGQMYKQASELKAGGAKSKPVLDRTVANLTSFLEVLTQLPPTPESLFFIANSYIALDKHLEAARILNRVTNLKPDRNNNQKQIDALVRAGRLMQIREYRLAGNFKEAHKIIEAGQGKDWGKRAEFAKEEALLSMAEEKYASAVREWKALMDRLAPNRDSGDPQTRELYDDCQYHFIWSIYKYALAQKDAKKKAEWIEAAAKKLVQLDASPGGFGGAAMKQRYEDLLAKEPALKKEFQRLKKSSK